MAVNHQQGWVRSRKTKKFGLVHVIGYRAQLADGTWRQKAETIRTNNKKKAKQVLDERLADINKGARLPAETTFKEFVEDSWADYLSEKVKLSTKASHESNTTKHLLPAFGNRVLSEIRPLELAQFFADKKEQGLSAKTRINIYLLLNKMFNQAIDLELLESSPMRKAFRPAKADDLQEKPTLTPAQVQAVVAAAPPIYRAMLVLFSLTSLRTGEVLGLKWSDIDCENKQLTVRRSLWRGKEQSPKSKASRRTKRMAGALVEALKRHQALSQYTEPDHYVFPNSAGRQQDADDLRKRVLYPAMDKAGIVRTARAYGFHILRHTAGTTLQEALGDLKKTSSFLGHASVAITGDVYAHLTPDSDQATAEALAKGLYGEDAAAFVGNLLPNAAKTTEVVQ